MTDPRDRRTALTYDDRLTQVAGQVAQREGVSGYFSAPTATLDPRLFDGVHLKRGVRSWILSTFFAFWERQGVRLSDEMAHVWLAGSGITYQWSAQRDPGDLDVLIGINSRLVSAANPVYAGQSEHDVAEAMNAKMKAALWPQTSNWRGFEVTFYINPGGQDIRNIHPYAAYDVSQGHWTVPPPQLTSDRDAAFSPEFKAAVAAEAMQGRDILARYEGARQAYEEATNPGIARNAEARLHQAVNDGAALFTDIHEGRHRAFAWDGQGYADYFNFRWQTHKRSGLVPALAQLNDYKKEAGL